MYKRQVQHLGPAASGEGDERERHREGHDLSLIHIFIAPTKEQAQAELDAAVAAIPELAARAGGVILGSPDEVSPIYERILASGVDGVTVNLPANGHVPGRVALLGETLAPVVNRS